MVNLSALAAASALLAPALGGGTSAGTGPARTYAWCQKKTRNPLEGCPKGTILVSKSSSKAKFSSIQDAILSLPNNTTPYTILIEPGNYTEQLNVTRSGPVTLLGVSDLPSQGKLYADIDYDTDHKNGVQVLWSAANHDSTGKSQDNYFSSVLTVAPNMNAGLTGSGPTGFPVPDDTPFGCSDFRAYNIDFRNVYSDHSDGPAHAVGVSRTNAGFYGCGFYSYQDTVYVGKLGNAYFYDSVAAGQTDFLYGFGTAFFEKSTLSLRNCGGGITAWKGTNTTFENKYGVYISDSRVIAANSTIAAVIQGRCPLGRPWNALHRSIFMASYLDASILPAGYIKWGSTDPRYTNTTVMAVWGDEGAGYNVTAMKEGEITIVMTDGEVGEYRWPKDVFITPEGEANNIGWIDKSVLVG